MMLPVVMLFAWLAPSVAFALPVHVIRNAHEFITSNVANTTTTGSNTSIGSSYYTDSSEERVGPSADINNILENLHASLFPSLTADLQQANIAILAPRIPAVNEAFNRLFFAMKHDEILEGKPFLAWAKVVKDTYEDCVDEVANKVMFAILAHHFQRDPHTLVRTLVKGTMTDDRKDIAVALLDLQYEAWVKERRCAKRF